MGSKIVTTSADLIKKICANPPQEVDFFQYLADEIYQIELNGTVETHVKQLAFLVNYSPINGTSFQY